MRYLVLGHLFLVSLYADVVRFPAPEFKLVLPYAGPTCSVDQIETQKINVACNLKTLQAYVYMDSTVDSGDCEVKKNAKGDIESFTCTCKTANEVTCKYVDEIVNNGNVCGSNGKPAKNAVCSYSYAINGPHSWGPVTINDPEDTFFISLKRKYENGDAWGSTPCNAMADSGLLFQQARAKCSADDRRNVIAARPQYRVDYTGVPCCKDKPPTVAPAPMKFISTDARALWE